MKKMRKALLAATAFVVVGPVMLTSALAQGEGQGGERASRIGGSGQQEQQQPARASQTLDPQTGLALQKIYELIQAEQEQAALAELNKLVAERGEKMSPFAKATTYEMRGSVRAGLDDYKGALADFKVALDTGALPPERNNQLRYFIAQIYFQLGDYPSAIRGLQEWIRTAQAAGQKVDCNAYYLLAAANIQITPPNYRAALPFGEQALACRTEPHKSTYDILNLIYSELGENSKRGALLEKMINFWPQERSYWTQLSGLYATTGKDSDAFAVLEVAYRAGLLKTEAEIVTLVQYFSFYENPFRGAKLLEREMETGTVKRTVRNLTLLSQLWSQAREHKRAIPVLQEASRQSDTGELSYRLGQVLLADEQYAASERALLAAINKGGMKQEQVADCWLLLGTARFNAAKPDDRAARGKSREAFVKASNYEKTAYNARQWVQYIDAINRVEEEQDAREKDERILARSQEIQRQKQALQVCRLQNRAAAECAAIEKRLVQLQAEPADAPLGTSASRSAAEPAAAAPTEASTDPQPEPTNQ
jgi:tetratricopeptide (TPR) repeat protein